MVLDGYKQFSNTLRFPVTTHLFSAVRPWHMCQQTILCSWTCLLGTFTLQLQLLNKTHCSCPCLTNQESWLHIQSVFVFCGHQLGFALSFALEFTYCSSFRTLQRRWRASQTADLLKKRLRLAMPTGWLQTLHLAPSLTMHSQLAQLCINTC